MSYSPPRTTLLATPSRSRGDLIAKFHSFFQEAQTNPTLSPHVFDAWFFTLTTEDRATVHEILQPLNNASWPQDVEFPNIIALVHWTRDHREGEKTQKIVEHMEDLRKSNAGTTQPEPEPPVPGPTRPGGIDDEPQAIPARPMEFMAVVIMVLAPAWLVRLLAALLLLLQHV
ncbi:hypothetical protein BKA58DRAFT_463595 [Alternaria rosae]|uniref:uncharacterized protein n=1 Tax=Alternaria rosae TaxID=1187941 RepID=UPI001E8D0C73|nr:uncharacterized protein BKA58DRAFT_463595 [Alternaria rosae]KAH6881502.1 hypothetical protein BKA58DRAFT_463595 [Alternaria rosae]